MADQVQWQLSGDYFENCNWRRISLSRVQGCPVQHAGCGLPLMVTGPELRIGLQP